MSDLTAIVNKYIGRPWNRNGFDCWQFVRAIYFDAYGITLSDHGGIQLSKNSLKQVSDEMVRGVYSDGWLPVSKPQPGDLALLGRREWPHHCGIWLDGELIAHNAEDLGVIVSRQTALKASGWGFFNSYRHGDLIK